MAALATPAFLKWTLGPNELTRPCPRDRLKGALDKTSTETELVSRMLKGGRAFFGTKQHLGWKRQTGILPVRRGA